MFAGQKGYMLQYDRLTDGEKLERYMELEPDLIIRDYEDIRRENRMLRKQVGGDEDLRRQNRELTERVVRLEEKVAGAYGKAG